GGRRARSDRRVGVPQASPPLAWRLGLRPDRRRPGRGLLPRPDPRRPPGQGLRLIRSDCANVNPGLDEAGVFVVLVRVETLLLRAIGHALHFGGAVFERHFGHAQLAHAIIGRPRADIGTWSLDKGVRAVIARADRDGTERADRQERDVAAVAEESMRAADEVAARATERRDADRPAAEGVRRTAEARTAEARAADDRVVARPLDDAKIVARRNVDARRDIDTRRNVDARRDIDPRR